MFIVFTLAQKCFVVSTTGLKMTDWGGTIDGVKNRVEKQVKPNRFMELEGLRVIAAIVVVFYHAALIFYPGYFYGVGNPLFSPVQNMRFEDNIYQNPLAGLLSGTFAVGVFFVLSGFVLSVGYFKKRDPSAIVKMASKRYLRLMLPALASVLLAFCLIAFGFSQLTTEAAAVTHSGWLSMLWHVPTDVLRALHQGAVAVFTAKEVDYNPVLWTIYYEFIGSFIVFGVALLFGLSRYRWVVYGVLLYALANSWLLGFIAGMALADVYVNRQAVYEKLNHWWTYGLLLIGIVLGGYPSGTVSSPIYKHLIIPGFLQTEQISLYITIGAVLVVVSALSLTKFKKILAYPRLSNLGKYTYSLYLVHMPILFTICTGLFLWLQPIGFHKASLLAISLTMILLIPIVLLFERYVDAPAIRFASYCANLYIENRRPAFANTILSRVRFIKKKLVSLKKASRAAPEIDMEVE
jgi:peptidoglycan/LPS O-acetylase OafA/YrhL